MKTYHAQPLDLMQFINTKYHDPFIHACIAFETPPDAEKLLRAIGQLAEAFPLWKCRYDPSDNTYIENEGFSARDLLRIDDTAGRTTLLTEALDMDKQLVRFTLSGNMLVITISHLICDGSGFKQLLYLLCDFYNGRAEEQNDYLMVRAFSQLTEGLKRTGAITFRMLLSLIGNYKSRQIYEKADHENIYVIERTVDSETMSGVHALAKKQGATLNDVFLTAYARALGSVCGFRKINLPCTVDLRKYAKDRTGIGNLTGSYNFNIRLKDGSCFRDTLADASAIMKKQKQTGNDIAGPLLLVSKYEKSTLADFLRLYGGMETSAFTDYTNLGILDDRKLIFDGATVRSAVGYSGLNKAPCFQIAVSTFKGETTVSSLVRCSEEGKKRADLILDAIVREIRSFQ